MSALSEVSGDIGVVFFLTCKERRVRKDLKLWTLEERRNRQDLIEVLKICNGLSRIKLNELFTLDDNIKGTRGHSWKLAKFRCIWDPGLL